MNLFVAAVYTNSYKPGQNRYLKLTEHEQSLVRDLPNILESWHYVGKQKFVDEMRADGAKVFLDSGAFSAHTLGVQLNIEDYCNYINRNLDILRVEDGAVMASVLDGIGDPQKTYENQLHMEFLKCKPLPCYHFGEDERWLEWYVKNYDYITIGGMVGRSTEQLITWLDRVWEKHMVDGTGKAKLKVHGFGITTTRIMERYPWFSCDSSSWIQAAAFGSIFTAEHGPIAVSDKSPARHDAGRHITNLTTIEQNYLFTMLEKQGFTYERLSTVYESRAAYNLWAYGILNAVINAAHDKTFKARVQELF